MGGMLLTISGSGLSARANFTLDSRLCTDVSGTTTVLTCLTPSSTSKTTCYVTININENAVASGNIHLLTMNLTMTLTLILTLTKINIPVTPAVRHGGTRRVMV